MKLTDPANEIYKIYVLSSPSQLPEIEEAFKTPDTPFDQGLRESFDHAATRSSGEGRKGEPRSGDQSAVQPTALQRALQQGVVQLEKFEIHHLEGTRANPKPPSP